MEKIFSLLAALLILSACSELELGSHLAKKVKMPSDPVDTTGYFKVGTPYKIKGRVYQPTEKYQYSEMGVASWYGPGFHGKMTANGEIFNKYELTAAHKTLQMPSMVRVTNMDNGRSIIVRVNDRGPFSDDRVIDLSEKAAKILGMIRKGTANVRIDVLEKESRQVAQAARDGRSTRGTEVVLNRGHSLDSKMPLKIAKPILRPKTPVRHVSNQNYAPPIAKSNFSNILIKQANAAPLRKPATQQIIKNRYIVRTDGFQNEDDAFTMKLSLRQHGVVSKSLNGYALNIGPLSNVMADNVAEALTSRGREAEILSVQN